MRLAPRSLAGRLLAIATLTTLAALAFAAVSIGHVLERFVIHGLDQQLDAQIGVLARDVRADGTLDIARVVDLPAFATPGSGWSWRVEGPGGRSWTNGAPDVVPRPEPPEHRHRSRDEPGPRPGEGRDAAGEPVHLRQLAVATPAGPVTIIASGPRRVALTPLREAMAPLLGSLALLGLALMAAIWVQLRVGLRPLRRLSTEVGEVRAGRLHRIPAGQPDELVPLAAELNALIDQNEAGLEHARRHVSNLAHGLKTPLAALGVRLADEGRDPDGSLRQMVRQLDERVRHHLGRARAAAPGGTQRARTSLASTVADLVLVLQRLHAERVIGVAVAIADDLAAAVDRQDLDEMAGNLLDNAWRHARGKVTVAAARAGGMIELTIDDDGAGLSEAAIADALMPGRRLDERGDGHGFGLPIAEELAQLNGGGLALRRSPRASGLRAVLTLPAASQE